MKKQLNILFVSFIGDLKNTAQGFIKKDLEKVDALNSLDGVTCNGVTFAYGIEKDYYFNSNFLVKKLIEPKKHKYFNSFYKDKYECEQLDLYLQETKFDVILSRYNVATEPLFKLVKKYKKKIIFEHNSFEYDELYLGINGRRSLLKFSLKPGYFIYYLEGKLWPLFSEKYFGLKVRKYALAGISVTKEIAEYQQKLVTGYTNKVIANGIKYDSSIIHTPLPFNGNELKLFMLLGTGAPWHGIDRIIEGLKNYKGTVSIYIDIIGYYYKSDEELVKQLGLDKNIQFVNPMSGEELNEQLKKHHISIGTLAVHRKKLKEATPLKVRESLMRGFPVIIGYTDTDFVSKTELNRFILDVPANDAPIDFEKVVKFASDTLTVPNYNTLISKLAKPLISYEIKAKETVDFVNQMLP